MLWRAWNDGWFEYWYCPECGHKQQLLNDKRPLPELCPVCHNRLIWDPESVKQENKRGSGNKNNL